MSSQTAPFRADEVGSLLRPQRLKEARAAFQAGTLDRAGLTAVEDECIRGVVAKQESTGLKAVTDGEFRRSWWHFDFLAGLDGVELVEGAKAIQFAGVQTKSESIAVTGKVGFSKHPMLEHFGFLKGAVKTAMPKLTIPSPSVLHFRGGRDAISKEVYPDMDAFYADTAEAYATPRRLALVVDGLPAQQPDLTEEKKGPKYGAPAKAIQGFMKANGIKSLDDEAELRETLADYLSSVGYDVTGSLSSKRFCLSRSKAGSSAIKSLRKLLTESEGRECPESQREMFFSPSPVMLEASR